MISEGRLYLPVFLSAPKSGALHKYYFHVVCVLGAQLCLTLCDPVYCSPPGPFVHGIFQVRILEWVAIFFSRGSSAPRDPAWVSCIAGRSFTI